MLTIGNPADLSTLADQAVDQARTAAASAGVRIETLSEIADLQQVIGLFNAVWGITGQPPISLEHLRALAYAGNYVAGMYDDDVLVGASVAFFGTPLGRSLHSDVTAVGVTGRGRGLGFALKLHQRAWALKTGVTEVSWTFDPLVARNAYLNLAKLGATGQRYLPDFYGEMTDAINVGHGSDRLLVSWDLTSPVVVSACSGSTRPTAAQAAEAPMLLCEIDSGPNVGADVSRFVPFTRIAIPPDIESMRTTAPHVAHAWRSALRDVMSAELASGGRVSGFDRSGFYVIDRMLAVGRGGGHED